MKKIKRQLVCNQFAMCRIIESLIFTPEKRIVCQLYFKKKKKMKPQKFVVDLTSCISLLQVLYNTTDCGMLTIEIYFLKVLEVRSLRSSYRQNCFFLRTLREVSISGNFPWFMNGCLLPVPSHNLLSLCVCVQIFLSSYKSITCTGLGPIQ